MITHYRGKAHIEWYNKVASTAFALNDLTYIDSNGYLAPAVDGAAIKPVGLIQKVVASTDSDYASTTMVPVLVPTDETCEFLCDVNTGTPAQTDIGEHIDIDNAKTVDVVASTYDIFFVTAIVSSTQVIAKLNIKTGAAA